MCLDGSEHLLHALQLGLHCSALCAFSLPGHAGSVLTCCCPFFLLPISGNYTRITPPFFLSGGVSGPELPPHSKGKTERNSLDNSLCSLCKRGNGGLVTLTPPRKALLILSPFPPSPFSRISSRRSLFISPTAKTSLRSAKSGAAARKSQGSREGDKEFDESAPGNSLKSRGAPVECY